MTIDFSPLNFTFSKKPLLVGGKAMEYYGLRKAGADIDIIIVKEDLARLIKLYPTSLKDLWGDFGVAVHSFEIWKTIDYFGYDYLSENSIEEENFRVISLEKLLMQKALAMKKPKYHADLEMIVNKITDEKHAEFNRIKSENEELLKTLDNFEFVEKSGP